jgi:hypothetical protein
MSKAEAYRQAVSDVGTPKTSWEEGSRLASKVAPRIQELRDAFRGQVDEAFVYRWQEAMAELTELHRAAFAKGDYGAAAAAIGKKCKISGLEVDPRMNARTPFQDASDDELDAEIARAQKDLKQATAH